MVLFGPSSQYSSCKMRKQSLREHAISARLSGMTMVADFLSDPMLPNLITLAFKRGKSLSFQEKKTSLSLRISEMFFNLQSRERKLNDGTTLAIGTWSKMLNAQQKILLNFFEVCRQFITQRMVPYLGTICFCIRHGAPTTADNLPSVCRKMPKENDEELVKVGLRRRANAGATRLTTWTHSVWTTIEKGSVYIANW